MRSRALSLVIIANAVGITACATPIEWAAWRSHSTHFASVDHLTFSLRNRDGEPPPVTRHDTREAQTQGWWGDPVTVSPSQVLAR
jgi:hypothetical protein